MFIEKCGFVQAGLIAIRKWHRLALVRDDPEEMGRLLAEEKPMWEPGAKIYIIPKNIFLLYKKPSVCSKDISFNGFKELDKAKVPVKS